MDEREEAGAVELLRLVAENALHRRADVAKHAVPVRDRGDVERVLDHGPKARFAVAQGLLGRPVRGLKLGSALRDAALELVLVEGGGLHGAKCYVGRVPPIAHKSANRRTREWQACLTRSGDPSTPEDTPRRSSRPPTRSKR